MSFGLDKLERTEDIGLSVFLAGIFLYLPLLIAGSYSATETSTVMSLLTTALFLSASFTVVRHPLLRLWAIALSLTAVCSHWTSVFWQGLQFDTLRLVSAMLFFIVITGSLSRQVFRPGRVTGHRIRGAVAVYLLIGLLWSFAYTLLDLYVPNAFSETIKASEPGSRFQQLVYFSFVTLTTVGYGDMAPIAPLSRGLAITEAILGQMYLAVVLARMVSLELSSRPDEDSE